jgi:transcriptional regulator
MAEEPRTELEKTLRALLFINLEEMKQKPQITILDKAGFGQSEIAQIIGTTPKAVSVRLAEIRREARSRDPKSR